MAQTKAAIIPEPETVYEYSIRIFLYSVNSKKAHSVITQWLKQGIMIGRQWK